MHVWQAHRQSWITESDFQLLAAAGINSIRFGVGWWVLAETAAECQPMVERGYEQVCAAMLNRVLKRTWLVDLIRVWR